MNKNASKIITEIKLRGNLPEDGDFLYKDDSDVLILLNAVLQNEILPLYIENEPSYRLAYEDFDIGNQRVFTIPKNAHNASLYEVQIISSTGDEQNVPFLPYGTRFHSIGYAGMRILDQSIHLQGYTDAINSSALRLYYHKSCYPLVLDNQVISLANPFSYQDKQRFRISPLTPSSSENTYTPTNTPNLLSQLPYQVGDPVFIQDSHDPSNIIKDNIALLIPPNELALEKTENDSLFRYRSTQRLTPANTVSFPEIPTPGVELLILRTLMSMSLSNETRYRVRDQLRSQEALLLKNLTKRVRLETSSSTTLNPLWREFSDG